MATRGRSYAENLIGNLDRSSYNTQRDVAQQTYNTNWQNIQNQYKNLTEKLKRQQEQANKDFANGLVQVASNSFDRVSSSNNDLVNRGLTTSGLSNLLTQSDTQMKGDEIGKLLKSADETISLGAEQLKDANTKLVSEQIDLNKGLSDALGAIGDNETSAQNAFNNALADIAEAMESREDSNDLAAKQRAASRSGSSGKSKEEEELNDFYKKMAINEILSSEDMTDKQKSNSLAILFGTKYADNAVGAFNRNATATDTRNAKIKELQDKIRDTQKGYIVEDNNIVNPYDIMLSYGDNLSDVILNNKLPYSSMKVVPYTNPAQTELDNLLKTGLTYEDLAKMLYG